MQLSNSISEVYFHFRKYVWFSESWKQNMNWKIRYSYLSELLLLAMLWSSVDSFGFCRMLVFSGDSSRPKRSCITLDLFECPTLVLLEDDVEKLPTPPPFPSLLPVSWTLLLVVMAVVVVTSAVVLFESCCCCCNCTVGFFVPGLSSNSDRSKY